MKLGNVANKPEAIDLQTKALVLAHRREQALKGAQRGCRHRPRGTLKSGTQDATAIAYQAHKRAGKNPTKRDGQLLQAYQERDGIRCGADRRHRAVAGWWEVSPAAPSGSQGASKLGCWLV